MLINVCYKTVPLLIDLLEPRDVHEARAQAASPATLRRRAAAHARP